MTRKKKLLLRMHRIFDKACQEVGVEKVSQGPAIPLKLLNGRKGWFATVSEKRIYIPVITDWNTFLIALHEVGHVAEGISDSRIETERAADRWAAVYAKTNGLHPRYKWWAGQDSWYVKSIIMEEV